MKARLLQTLLLLGMAAVPAMADVTYNFTSLLDHCTGGCGPGYGTVTLSQVNSTTVSVDLEMSGYLFANTGAGTGYQFFFNLKNNPTISADFTNAPGFKLVNTSVSNPLTFPGDGYGDLFEYAVVCAYTGGACDKNGTTTTPVSLKFNVSVAGGLLISDFEETHGTQSDDNAYFVADVSAPNGKTGLVGALDSGGGGGTTSTVPEPASIILLGSLISLAAVKARKSV